MRTEDSFDEASASLSRRNMESTIVEDSAPDAVNRHVAALLRQWEGDDWHIDDVLGRGSFGKVYKISKTEFGHVEYAALKHMELPRDEREIDDLIGEGKLDGSEASAREYYQKLLNKVYSEIEVMKELMGYTNIVSYSAAKTFEKKDRIGYDILIRMELLTSLQTRQKQSMTQEDVAKLGVDICSALEILEKRNMIHRDIKPANIFLNKTGDYKLGDFGIAKTMDHTSSFMTKAGTVSYMAPEIYLHKPVSCAADQFSLGIVMYRLLNGLQGPFLAADRTPTSDEEDDAFARRIRGEAFPKPAYADTGLSQIILRACAFKAEDRYPSPEAMRQDLQRWLESPAGFVPGFGKPAAQDNAKERQRQEQEEKKRREQEEKERQRREQEEKKRREQEEKERQRREQEEKKRREQEEKERQRREQEEKKRREREEKERQRKEQEKKKEPERRKPVHISEDGTIIESENGETIVEPDEGRPAPSGGGVKSGTVPKPKKKKRRWLPIAGAILLIVLLIVIFSKPKKQKSGGSPSPSLPSVTATVTAEPSQEATPANITSLPHAPVKLKTREKTLTLGGNPFTLEAKNVPDGAALRFESTDPAIVTVSENGEITPVGAGDAVVIMTVIDGETELRLECLVHVQRADLIILASAGEGGSIEPVGRVAVRDGETAHFTIAANSGWHISDVLVNGKSVGAVDAYDFANLAAEPTDDEAGEAVEEPVGEQTIEAVFAADGYTSYPVTMTLSAGAGGRISPSGKTTIDAGTLFTFTVTPDSGYHIADVRVGSESVGAVSSYSLYPWSNKKIEATFAKDADGDASTPKATPTPVEILTLGGQSFEANVTKLVLQKKDITDISVLAKCTALVELNLNNNNISDLTPLANLTTLQKLYLNNNKITDISPLRNLTNLNTLQLQGNSITDWSPVDFIGKVAGRK